MLVKKLLSFLVFSTLLSSYESTSFPKCEDIVQVEDGKPTCEFCYTKRVHEKCKDVCKKLGCKNAVRKYFTKFIFIVH